MNGGGDSRYEHTGRSGVGTRPSRSANWRTRCRATCSTMLRRTRRAQRALGLVAGRHRPRGLRRQPPGGVEGLDRVVRDEARDHHQIRLERRGNLAEEQQFLDRTVALHAGVDHAVADTGRGARVEAPLEDLGEGLRQRHLHGEHERVAEHDDAALAGRLGGRSDRRGRRRR